MLTWLKSKITEPRLGVPKDKTYVMPAGDTRATLVEMYPKVFEMVAEHGYNMTGRDHIIAYDTETRSIMDRALELLEQIEENVSVCCAITMEPDEVLALIEELREILEKK
jgi:3-deoxy-D-arabino-heptulosonate 7-phosphate (DAHP) synthase class II